IDGEGNYDSSGQSVSLSSDGSIVAIGAYGNDGNGTDSGHVRVYQNNSGNWEQIGSDIDGEAASNYFGYSVSLSSDGSIVAIGAHGNDDNGTNSGHVRIYKYESGTSNWSQIGSDIDGEAASDESGRSVSLSSDGSTVAIGAWLNDGNGTDSGHVRVFDTGLSANTGTLTIVDDDPVPTLSINDVSYTETSSASNATFTVTLSEASGQDVTVDYASSDVSTTAGSDYTASSGTVTISAGATSATFTVPILVDTLDESNETATVTLSNASNASISDATGTLTIVDDDGDTTASAATLTISLSDFTGATTTSVPSGASGLNAIVEDNLNQAINGTSSADYIEIQDSASSNAGSISGGTGDDIIYIKGWGGATNSSVTGDGGSDTLVINPSIYSSKSNWNNNNGIKSGTIHFTNGGSININNIETVKGIGGGAGGQFERNISVTATLNDTDGSESLSDITVSNLPDNTTVKDSNGNAVTVSSNAFTVDNVVSGTAQVFTLTKAGPFDFTASGAITVTESNGGATTTTNSSVLIDGVVEGVEYLTTSGMSGLTNQEG
ncbi:MAG: hypothetical protein GY918_14825, partial [Gammaproteobacteria bacterium]|nr:hypothetical protein [Gammaproteobacteria bacterium]